MAKTLIGRLFNREKPRRFKAWQIELTTRCPLRCAMCVRQAYKGEGRKDMALSDFKKIVPYLKDVENVVLEGWGESLLHKDLVECIELIKKEGARAGFVTSGAGLNEEYVRRLVRVGLDFIGFSLSGATPETHNRIRVNSDFVKLIESIKLFRDLTARTRKPRMHIVYLMLKENMAEVPLLPDLAKEVGVEEIVLINIIQVANKWQAEQKVYGSEDEKQFREILRKAERKAKRLRLSFVRSSLAPNEVAVCSEDPLRSLYISVDGEVSPCVHLYPPVPSPFTRIFRDEEYCVEKVSFGNIFREPFESIWNREEYARFRDRVLRRKLKAEQVYKDLLSLKRPEQVGLPEAPSACKSCHKMLGV